MTREEIIETFMAIKPRPKLTPKPPAEVKAKERWDEEAKPSEVIYSTAAVHNDAATRRMQREREEYEQYARDGQDQRVRYQRELDRWWQSMRDARQEERRYRQVGGFLEGGLADYNPIQRYEREE